MWLIAASMMLAQPAPEPLSPADSVTQAASWIASGKAPPDGRYVRFLSLYNVDPTERSKITQIISGFANSLSRAAKLTPVQVVPGTDNALVWIDLRWYRWSSETWESLRPLYFTTQIETFEEVVIWPAIPAGGMWPVGRPWTDGATYPREFKVKNGYPAVTARRQVGGRQQAAAPWLADTGEQKAALAAVNAWTYSAVPIVRADWFVHEASVQRAKGVGYYDWIGIKNQKDYETLVRFDAKLSAETEHRRVTIFSGILNQDADPRRLERVNTVLGGLWRTFDSELGQDKKNALRALDNDLEFDATEQIAPAINGMPMFLLANNKGVLQNKAPDNIVGGDRTAHGNNTNLLVGLSCWRCHWGTLKDEQGVKEFQFARVKKLKTLDYEKGEELVRQYLRDLGPAIKTDRAIFEAAIKEATGGMTGFEFASGLQRIYAGYEAPRTPDLFAKDLGFTKAAMLKVFAGYNDATDALDPVLSILLAGDPIPFRSGEEAHAVAQQVMRSVRFDKPGKN